jgi:hypothetical protein
MTPAPRRGGTPGPTDPTGAGHVRASDSHRPRRACRRPRGPPRRRGSLDGVLARALGASTRRRKALARFCAPWPSDEDEREKNGLGKPKAKPASGKRSSPGGRGPSHSSPFRPLRECGAKSVPTPCGGWRRRCPPRLSEPFVRRPAHTGTGSLPDRSTNPKEARPLSPWGATPVGEFGSASRESANCSLRLSPETTRIAGCIRSATSAESCCENSLDFGQHSRGESAWFFCRVCIRAHATLHAPKGRPPRRQIRAAPCSPSPAPSPAGRVTMLS